MGESTVAAALRKVAAQMAIRPWTTGVEEAFRELADELDPPANADRDPSCVARWPECEDGFYDPRCCRFPKSCSPHPPATTFPEATDGD